MCLSGLVGRVGGGRWPPMPVPPRPAGGQRCTMQHTTALSATVQGGPPGGSGFSCCQPECQWPRPGARNFTGSLRLPVLWRYCASRAGAAAQAASPSRPTKRSSSEASCSAEGLPGPGILLVVSCSLSESESQPRASGLSEP